MSSVGPKGYQQDALNSALEVFRYAESQLQQVATLEDQRTISAYNGCVLLEAPTGAGKTLMAGLIAESFARPDHRDNAKIVWFWFTPFAGLVEQAKSALKRDFNGLRIRDLSSERKTYSANSGDVFVTTWASVAARNAETRKLRSSGDLSLALDEFIPELREAGFRIGVVVDEAHHSFTKATETVNFYRQVMRPEFSLLITATPDDADVEKFKKAAGLAVIHRIQVSRQDAVEAGLIKDAVKSIAYLVPDDQQGLVDLSATALEDCWRTHQTIKTQLAAAEIRLTPLMLVQVGKAGETAIEQAKQGLLKLGVPEDAIAWYTADDPNDDLLAVARDESKEVLIFKVAVALGFDAPRAFTLVSLRGTKSTDFGIQVVGRILRVHPKLQAKAISKTLPNLLRFGYVFLADADSQGGLLGAGAKINAITTQLAEITPHTLVVKMGGQTETQELPASGQISLLPQPYVPPVWQPEGIGDAQAQSSVTYLQGSTLPLFDDWLAPQPTLDKKPGIDSMPRQPLAGNRQFTLRDSLPNRFKTEQLPLSTTELEQCICKRARLDAAALNAGLRKSLKITRKTADVFGEQDETVDSILAKLSDAEIARRAQRVLFDADYFDPRELNSLLLDRLRNEYNEHQGMDLNDLELARALNLILATFPHLVRDAARICSANFKEVFDAAALPVFVESPDCVARSRLNVYGLMPQDLNDTERRFAEILDTDTSGTVQWWHRNEARKPWSVGIVMPNGDRYFPDFIVGVNGRSRYDDVLLLEIKGGHIVNSDETLEKLNAEHKQYGKPLMLTRQDDGKFWIMRYIESSRKAEQDQVFRIENMGQY